MNSWSNTLQKGKRFLKSLLIFLKLYPEETKIEDVPFVYRACDTQIEFLSAKKGTANALPEQLIIEPNHYLFDNKCYDLTKEGLYRFSLPRKNINIQRIVFKKNTAALISSLAWIATHGARDDARTPSELIEIAMTDKLILTCESQARLGHAILKECLVQSRIIGGRTLETMNGFDDGHYLLEVYREDLNKWVLYDLDSDTCFQKNNQLLSLAEFIQCLDQKDYEICYLSSDIRAAVSDSQFSFVYEARIANLKSWYQRIMQFTFIIADDENISCSEPPLMYRYPKGAFPKINYLSKEAFNHRFY